MDDKELLRGLKDADPAALEGAVRRYGAYVTTVIRRRLLGRGEEEDIEEMVSNTFVALWRARGSIRGETLGAWLAAVARREAIHYLRLNRPPRGSEEEYLAAEDEEAGKAYDRKELGILLEEAMGTLEKEDKDIFILHYFASRTVGEIAETLALNPETVKSRLSRGRGKLKNELMKRGYELEDQHE